MASTVKIESKRQNSLLDRLEVKLTVYHPRSATPDKRGIAQDLSEQLSVSKENIVVRDCKTRFGGNVSTASAKIYNRKEQLEKVERRFVLDRVNREKGIERQRMGRKLRKEEKNKAKKIRGTKQAYSKKVAKRQEKNN